MVNSYNTPLLERVDRSEVISDMGERPAVIHLHDWKLTGFTTGLGCLMLRLSSNLLAACQAGHFAEAEEIRTQFLALEGIRDAWGPARVLRQAVELAQIAETGSIPPLFRRSRASSRSN
jgi:dihydrodipicolinate synthase/N-acetylneuraminate lyase